MLIIVLNISTTIFLARGPLFLVTLANYTDDWKAAQNSIAHEVTTNSSPIATLGLPNRKPSSVTNWKTISLTNRKPSRLTKRKASTLTELQKEQIF